MLNPVTDLSALAEQQCRIEHKLDLIIRYLATKDGAFELTPLKEGVDPLTHKPVEYFMDLMKRHVIRRSSDGTGLLPPSSVLFDSPVAKTTGNNNGGSSGDVG